MNPAINPRRIWMITAAAVFVFLFTLVVCTISYQYEARPNMAEFTRVFDTAQAYRRGLAKHGSPAPASVSLHQLLEKGYLRPNEIAGFGGLEASISMQPGQGGLTNFLMSVRLADGRTVAALNDGSVHELPGSR